MCYMIFQIPIVIANDKDTVATAKDSYPQDDFGAVTRARGVFAIYERMNL